MKIQTKTNEVLEFIFSKITCNEKFTEMEAARIKREINTLPEFSEIQMSLGLLYTAQKDSLKAIKHFEKAISLVNAPTSVYLNYLHSLSCLNLNHDYSIKSLEFAHITNSPELYNIALCASTYSLNKSSYDTCLEQLNKMNKLQKTIRNNDSIKEMNIISSFVEYNNITDEQLEAIGNIAVQTSQEYGVKMLGNRIAHRAERRYLSVDYHISSESSTSDKVCDLNYSFIEKLIDNELDELPVTITFIRISHDDMIKNIEKGNMLDVS